MTAKLQRRPGERELDDTFGGRLYVAAAQDEAAALREWNQNKYWAEVNDNDVRCGSLTGVDTRNRRLVFVDDTERKQHRVVPASVLPVNPALLDAAEDLTALSHLHAPGVLHHLQKRYGTGKIYTFSGPILIAINPYRRVDGVYTPEVLAQYAEGRADASVPRTPHVYAIGEQAYRAMRAFGRNQSILVTGESGAGKTETTKILLQYFATKGSGSGATGIEKRVLGTTPILESFGNAKTLRNDNSSRFGKFILVDFDDTGAVAGAQLRTYLLEKARLTHQTKGERTYHIFYQLLAYCAEEPDALPSAKGWQLLEPRAYRFLNSHGGAADDLIIDGVDDAAHFRITLTALQTIGMDVTEVDRICGVLVGLLALGNIQFTDNAREEAQLGVTPRGWIGEAAILLGLSEQVLLACLTTRKIKAARGESFTKIVRAADAEVARDSLAVFLYECLFTWLVERINEAVRPPVSPLSPRAFASPSPRGPVNKTIAALGTHRSRGMSAVARPPPPQTYIGVLDIYGFETFDVNSFEQFCINYANEKLQHQFNHHMFKLEQEEYESEGIDWRRIEFVDNSGCIHHIENSLGVIDLLNEETRLGGTADNFVHKLNKKPARASYVRDNAKNKARAEFGVRHYPGPVTYDAAAFIEKNRTAYPLEFLAAVLDDKGASCANTLVYTLCSGFEELRKQMAASKKDTVATQFKDSLTELMATIATTQPNYIRCIKPNDTKAPLGFVPQRVLEQLRCGGVMEAIRIAQAGYPTRTPYQAFGTRYAAFGPHGERAAFLRALDPVQHASNETYMVAAQAALLQLTKHASCLPTLEALLDGVQFGRSKIFLKSGVLGRLEEALTGLQTRSATVLQSHVRRLRATERHEKLIAGVVALQALFQRRIAVKCVAELKRQRAVLVIQHFLRAALARKELARRKQHGDRVKRLQAHIRGFNVRLTFGTLRNAVVTIQRYVRAIPPRQRLLELKAEMRSAEGVKARAQASEARAVELARLLDVATKRVQDLERALVALRADLEDAKQRATNTTRVEELEKTIRELREDLTESRRKEEHSIEYMGFILKKETERAEASDKRAKEAEDGMACAEAREKTQNEYIFEMSTRYEQLYERATDAQNKYNARESDIMQATQREAVLVARVAKLFDDQGTNDALLQDEYDKNDALTAELSALKETQATNEAAWHERTRRLVVQHDEALINEGRARADVELERDDLRGRLKAIEQQSELASTALADQLRAALEQVHNLQQDATEREQRNAQLQAELAEARQATAAQKPPPASNGTHRPDSPTRSACAVPCQHEQALSEAQKRAEATQAAHTSELARIRAEHQQATKQLELNAVQDLDARLKKYNDEHEQKLLDEYERAEAATVELSQATHACESLEKELLAAEEKLTECESRCEALTQALQESRAAASHALGDVSTFREAVRKANAEASEAQSEAATLRATLDAERQTTNEMARGMRVQIEEMKRNETEFTTKMRNGLQQIKAQKENGHFPVPDYHGPASSSSAEALLDRTLSTRHPFEKGQCAFLTDALLRRFLEAEAEPHAASATPVAAVILARWLIRHRASWASHQTLLPVAHTLRDAASYGTSAQKLAWLFKTTAALYALVSTAVNHEVMPETLELEICWAETPQPRKLTDAEAAASKLHVNEKKRKRDLDVTVRLPEDVRLSISLASELQVAVVTMFGRLIRPPARKARETLRQLTTLISIAPRPGTEAVEVAIRAMLQPLDELLLLLQQHCVMASVMRQMLQLYFALCDSTVFNTVLRNKVPPHSPAAEGALSGFDLMLDCISVSMQNIGARAGLYLSAAEVAVTGLFPYTTQLLNVLACTKDLLADAAHREDSAADLTLTQVWYICRLCQRDTTAKHPASKALLASLQAVDGFRVDDEVRLDDVFFEVNTQHLHISTCEDMERNAPAGQIVSQLMRFLETGATL